MGAGQGGRVQGLGDRCRPHGSRRRKRAAHLRALCVIGGLGGCLLVFPAVHAGAQAKTDDTLQGNDEAYSQAMAQGVEAFRQGDVAGAAKAFQAAYLIRPNDPKLVSWLALVRDEQARREAMGAALEELERNGRAAAEPVAIEPPATAESAAPLEERMALPKPLPRGLEQAVTPLEESRREILAEGKRAGFQRLYKEGIGFQPIRGLGFSGRTELYEEPNPIEALELDAKVLKFSELSQFKRSVVPLSTRSGAGRIVADYEPWPRLTYEYDARETLHQFQTKFGFKDIDLQTHAVNALYSLPRAPLLGVLTVNPWYKRVLQRSDHDAGAYEHRDELILNLSLQQTDHIEYFFQFDGYDADKVQTVGGSKLKLFKGQVRLRVPPLKLFAIPSFEYADTDYDPSDDEFLKKDLFVDWGFDLTPRLRASSKEQVIWTELAQAGKEPSNPSTEVYNTFNKLSYELFPDFDVSFGVDYSRSAGFNSFNNVGLRAEIELFKPGIIRSRLGYEWLAYYNISEYLSVLYWRFFLFQ